MHRKYDWIKLFQEDLYEVGEQFPVVGVFDGIDLDEHAENK